jgi:hypothetical protein
MLHPTNSLTPTSVEQNQMMNNFCLLHNLRVTNLKFTHHMDSLSLLKTSNITTNMRILHALPSHVTNSNLAKVPHVFSHHANSKLSVQRCNHTLQTTTDPHSNLTFNQTICPLPIQDKTATMIADLQHNKLALFNNQTTAQDHPSDPSHPTIKTKDILQTTTILQDKIPAHPMQQILYATTVED